MDLFDYPEKGIFYLYSTLSIYNFFDTLLSKYTISNSCKYIFQMNNKVVYQCCSILGGIDKGLALNYVNPFSEFLFYNKNFIYKHALCGYFLDYCGIYISTKNEILLGYI